MRGIHVAIVQLYTRPGLHLSTFESKGEDGSPMIIGERREEVVLSLECEEALRLGDVRSAYHVNSQDPFVFRARLANKHYACKRTHSLLARAIDKTELARN